MNRLLLLLRRRLHVLRVERELRSLDDRELDDLGIGRGRIAAIARAEADRLSPA